MRQNIRRPPSGFTLTELAIVLVIVALLIGGMMVPLTAQRDLQDYRETQKRLIEISESLLGYAASHKATTTGRPYFPCPDTNDDGLEDRVGNGCAAAEGRLPWSDLGVGREDTWGNRFRYRVDAGNAYAYSNSATGFALGQAATLRVCEESACAKLVAKDLPLVIVSHGKNGLGAFNSSGGTNPAPTGADEIANQNADNDFVSHATASTAGNEFDDLVAWISPNVLFNRMVAAGKLP